MNTLIYMIDPRAVPHRKLYTGAEMPAIGLGTFGSYRYSASEIAETLLGAAAIGYRHFDCAAVYGNEKEIGVSLQTIMKSGLSREDLWVTSKLWNDKHAKADVIPACQQSLPDLQLDYLDLYLIHITWLRGIRFNFATQIFDMHVNHAFVAFVGCALNVIKQIQARDGVSG